MMMVVLWLSILLLEESKKGEELVLDSMSNGELETRQLGSRGYGGMGLVRTTMPSPTWRRACLQRELRHTGIGTLPIFYSVKNRRKMDTGVSLGQLRLL